MLQAKLAIKQFISVQWIFVRHSLHYLVQEIRVCISISLPFLKVGTISQNILTVVYRKTRFAINSLNTGCVCVAVVGQNKYYNTTLAHQAQSIDNCNLYFVCWQQKCLSYPIIMIYVIGVFMESNCMDSRNACTQSFHYFL
jgi:hypothetical protein